MRRNLIAVSVAVGICLAAFVAMIALGIVYDLLVLIIVGAVMTAVALWVLIGSIYRERAYEKFDGYFAAGDYAAALTVLDRASENHVFFPVYRTVAYQLYVKGELAVDNVSQAAHYVELLRHNGGEGWKYRTAFYVVLFNLDWGDFAAAHDEFSCFEKACAQSPIYREQLEVLRALFALIGGSGEPLPESVKNSPYPVVARIVGRY